VRDTALQLVAAVGLALLAGCGGSSSPTAAPDPLVVVIESENLIPVKDACHMQGTVVNTGVLLAFDITLRWQAFDAANNSLGTTSVEIDNLLPGERRLYDATGFAGNDTGLIRCAQIARFARIQTTVNVH